MILKVYAATSNPAFQNYPLHNFGITNDFIIG